MNSIMHSLFRTFTKKIMLFTLQLKIKLIFPSFLCRRRPDGVGAHEKCPIKNIIRFNPDIPLYSVDDIMWHLPKTLRLRSSFLCSLQKIQIRRH